MILPDYVRQGLKTAKVSHLFGVQIENWAEGERYRSNNDVIYCKDGRVVSVRRMAKWIWREGEEV